VLLPGETGCGWPNRTAYLQVMSLSRCQCANPQKMTGTADPRRLLTSLLAEESKPYEG
jgi:hypothetical protein